MATFFPGEPSPIRSLRLFRAASRRPYTNPGCGRVCRLAEGGVGETLRLGRPFEVW